MAVFEVLIQKEYEGGESVALHSFIEEEDLEDSIEVALNSLPLEVDEEDEDLDDRQADQIGYALNAERATVGCPGCSECEPQGHQFVFLVMGPQE